VLSLQVSQLYTNACVVSEEGQVVPCSVEFISCIVLYVCCMLGAWCTATVRCDGVCRKRQLG
jgi:hypothetical protein